MSTGLLAVSLHEAGGLLVRRRAETRTSAAKMWRLRYYATAPLRRLRGCVVALRLAGIGASLRVLRCFSWLYVYFCRFLLQVSLVSLAFAAYTSVTIVRVLRKDALPLE